MTDTYDTLMNLHANLSRWAEAKAAGDEHAANTWFEGAETVLNAALQVAYAQGMEEGREPGDDRDPAEDYEPDISDVGFDPYLGSYTDDC